MQPTPDFAKMLLADLHVRANVHVISSGGYGGSSGHGCGGSWGPWLKDATWPEINQYALSLTKGTLFTDGIHPVRYYTYPSDGHPDADCSPRDDFLPGLLAQVSGIAIRELRLESELSTMILFRNADSYVAHMRAFLGQLNDAYGRLLAKYVRLGFLSAAESSVMRLPVELKIYDARTPGAVELPAPPQFDLLEIQMR